jgi:hypothetical protein
MGTVKIEWKSACSAVVYIWGKKSGFVCRSYKLGIMI